MMSVWYKCSVCKKQKQGKAVRISYLSDDHYEEDNDMVCPECWLKAHDALWPGRKT